MIRDRKGTLVGAINPEMSKSPKSDAASWGEGTTRDWGELPLRPPAPAAAESTEINDEADDSQELDAALASLTVEDEPDTVIISPTELSTTEPKSQAETDLVEIEGLVASAKSIGDVVEMARKDESKRKSLRALFDRCAQDMEKSDTFMKVADILVDIGDLQYSLSKEFPFIKSGEGSGSKKIELAEPFYIIKKAFAIVQQESVNSICEMMVSGELHPSVIKKLSAVYKTPRFRDKFLTDNSRDKDKALELEKKFLQVESPLKFYEQVYEAEKVVSANRVSAKGLAEKIKGGSVQYIAFKQLLKFYREAKRPDPYNNQEVLGEAVELALALAEQQGSKIEQDGTNI